jgi:flagellin-like hook-associated protein FlgL
METKDMLEWAALDGLTKEQLEDRIEQARDDINDALNMIQTATAKLAEFHTAPRRMTRDLATRGKVILLA